MLQATFLFGEQRLQVDLERPIDLSLVLRAGTDTVNCFWAPPVVYWPVRAGDFTGSTAEGGAVNFFNVQFNPHGNGTHTECVGHISQEPYKLRDCLRQFHFPAKVASLYPRPLENGDRVLFRDQLEEVLVPGEATAFILRTLPNDARKERTNHSGSNPPYLDEGAAQYLAACGVEHFLTDLPSVDREEDGGLLKAHRAFWRYPFDTRVHCTITELVYVPPEVPDGMYLLNLQTASFDLDASPSRPVLFPLLYPF